MAKAKYAQFSLHTSNPPPPPPDIRESNTMPKSELMLKWPFTTS